MTQVKTASGGVKVVKVWSWIAEDMALVPRDLFVLNTAEIDRLVREGVRIIPGIKIYQKEEVRNAGSRS